VFLKRHHGWLRHLVPTYHEFMDNLPRGVVWLISLCVTVLTAANIVTWVVVRTATAETVQHRASAFIWLNVALQAALLALAIYIAARLLRGDRSRRAAEARSRHLAELALLSGGLAHEIRNHLHALQSRIGLLRKSTRSDEALTARVEKLDEIVQAMEQILNDFLTFARPAADEPEEIDVSAVIRSVADFEALDRERANIHLLLELQHGVRVLVDRRKFQRALLNLMVNARQAMPDGGSLRVECRQVRSTVKIVVQDTGEGMPPENLPHVFESYFTTKPEGSGLGLAIVRRTIEDFGGRVFCTSRAGEGTSFTIELPAIERRAVAIAGHESPFAVAPESGLS
jgi:signal transduction histidine kinase